ncbi:hypothetical protein DFJ67_0534 [Asanoa ferruginea]|uniref:Uncharacterized protein n=1 Tax=Asanoa ferruginea TaxID=53367 RepID=A0A3D9ZBC1_9ACTN|nr:hypothetical protein DFJ67_0534 [Asanoa ferruginea]GIF50782.1 hypothetical protein Afe04nite_53210 [Asanoa ferruginea]
MKRRPALITIAAVMLAGALVITYFATRAARADVKIEVKVGINVCRGSECATVPLPASQVVAEWEDGNRLSAKTGSDGTATFAVRTANPGTITATSPLLSGTLTSPIAISPGVRLVTIELVDPQSVRLVPQ